MNPPDTIKQRSKVVPTAAGEITVRRMFNKPARAFINAFAQHLAERVDLLSPNANGTMALDLNSLFAHLPKIVLSAESLADQLITASTDVETGGDLLEKADLTDWLNVLAAAIELNLGEDLKNSFAGIGKALAPLLAEMSTKMNAGGKPTRS